MSLLPSACAPMSRPGLGSLPWPDPSPQKLGREYFRGALGLVQWKRAKLDTRPPTAAASPPSWGALSTLARQERGLEAEGDLRFLFGLSVALRAPRRLREPSLSPTHRGKQGTHLPSLGAAISSPLTPKP